MNKVLIVEDEPTISRVLQAYLSKNDMLTEQAWTGNEAVEKFTEHRPDLVLLDVMLPDKDGWAVLKEIREKSACPVIMLTALGEIDDKLKGFESGADDYIAKPFIGEEVVARVKAVLRRPAARVEDQLLRIGSLVVDRLPIRFINMGRKSNCLQRMASCSFFSPVIQIRPSPGNSCLITYGASIMTEVTGRWICRLSGSVRRLEIQRKSRMTSKHCGDWGISGVYKPEKRKTIFHYWSRRYLATLLIGLILIAAGSVWWIKKTTVDHRLNLMHIVGQEIADRIVTTNGRILSGPLFEEILRNRAGELDVSETPGRADCHRPRGDSRYEPARRTDQECRRLCR